VDSYIVQLRKLGDAGKAMPAAPDEPVAMNGGNGIHADSSGESSQPGEGADALSMTEDEDFAVAYHGSEPTCTSE